MCLFCLIAHCPIFCKQPCTGCTHWSRTLVISNLFGSKGFWCNAREIKNGTYVFISTFSQKFCHLQPGNAAGGLERLSRPWWGCCPTWRPTPVPRWPWECQYSGAKLCRLPPPHASTHSSLGDSGWDWTVANILSAKMPYTPVSSSGSAEWPWRFGMVHYLVARSNFQCHICC